MNISLVEVFLWASPSFWSSFTIGFCCQQLLWFEKGVLGLGSANLNERPQTLGDHACGSQEEPCTLPFFFLFCVDYSSSWILRVDAIQSFLLQIYKRASWAESPWLGRYVCHQFFILSSPFVTLCWLPCLPFCVLCFVFSSLGCPWPKLTFAHWSVAVKSCDTRTVEATLRVGARCVGVATGKAVFAFIDI